ncbi:MULTISPECIES: hypothetical protein [Rhizobium/Agrobacterium group]|uniref:calcium-binding protein n=1 Tax=Rhizobium/Agrobacterium group TaxID=227290 RepID=UPI0007870A8D|nr:MULTISPECIES: hypothetical protein [Rhizobium/Agrobacterium group]
MTTIYTKGGYLGSGASSDKLVALDGPAHLDGGAGSDNINGGKGDDILQGGKGNDYMYGGAGKDTFLWLATDVDGSTDKIFDFGGAGEASGDRLTFRGMGEGSSLNLLSHTAGTDGHVIYKYELIDTATGNHNIISIESVNGKPLTAGDYAFYGSVPVESV